MAKIVVEGIQEGQRAIEELRLALWGALEEQAKSLNLWAYQLRGIVKRIEQKRGH